jgi:hypothetical protein
MFLGLLDSDPNPLVRGMDPDPSIIKKNLDFYCFVTSFFDFLSLKNDVNVPLTSNMQKKLSGSTPKCHRSATLASTNVREGRWNRM